MVASALPLLEKLTSDTLRALLSPVAGSFDKRPIVDFKSVICQQGIFYIGLNTLTDPEVASAVGKAMFADLTSTAGRFYKYGRGYGLPGVKEDYKISIHADEFNALITDQFIERQNKGRGAGFEITAYTQTISDIAASLGGNLSKARQSIGNFGNKVMLRVEDKETADLITSQIQTGTVFSVTTESRVTDSSNPDSPEQFKSMSSDKIAGKERPLVSQADIQSLPISHAFAVLEGGWLYKLRFPLLSEVVSLHMMVVRCLRS